MLTTFLAANIESLFFCFPKYLILKNGTLKKIVSILVQFWGIYDEFLSPAWVSNMESMAPSHSSAKYNAVIIYTTWYKVYNSTPKLICTGRHFMKTLLLNALNLLCFFPTATCHHTSRDIFLQNLTDTSYSLLHIYFSHFYGTTKYKTYP